MSNLGLLGKNSNVLSKNFRILDSGKQSKSETNPRAKNLESIQILCPAHFTVIACFFFWLHATDRVAQSEGGSQDEPQALTLSGSCLTPTTGISCLHRSLLPESQGGLTC